MLIKRETKELWEQDKLHEYAIKSVASFREEDIVEHEYRTKFQRDRDRIIFSKYFRLLGNKTQVFLSPELRYLRTRLTHTLEVTQIARTTSRILNLNEDLTEAIALGHDLGHSPFGHVGEEALRECLKDHGGYEHNEQSLKIVDKIEKLNLTHHVKEGILRHTVPDESFYTDLDIHRDLSVYEEYGYPHERATFFEAQIVDVCDEIAYLTHDVEDLLSQGIITKDKLPRRYLENIGINRTDAVNRLVLDVVERGRKILNDEPLDEENPIIIYDDSELVSITSELKEFLLDKFNKPPFKTKETEAKHYVTLIFAYLKDISNEDIEKSIEEGNKREVAVSDFIIQLTDEDIITFYNEHFSPITKAP